MELIAHVVDVEVLSLMTRGDGGTSLVGVDIPLDVEVLSLIPRSDGGVRIVEVGILFDVDVQQIVVLCTLLYNELEVLATEKKDKFINDE